VISESRKLDSKGKPTKRALAAQRALKDGVIDVSGATVEVEMVTDDQGATSYVAGEFIADAAVYDGTEDSESVRKMAISTLTSSNDEQELGVFDKANKAITDRKNKEADDRRAERNRKAGNKVLARVKITL